MTGLEAAKSYDLNPRDISPILEEFNRLRPKPQNIAEPKVALGNNNNNNSRRIMTYSRAEQSGTSYTIKTLHKIRVIN